jgi:hypothetical protein
MRICIASVVVLLSSAHVSWAQAGPADFARGIEIRTAEPGAIFRVTLPRDVYATAARANLDDVRVFNADGTAVPITIRRSVAAPPADASLLAAPHFPMYTPLASSSQTSAQVRLDAQGAVVEVTGAAAPGQALSSYLIDVSGIDAPLAGLSLTWTAREDASFLAHLRVEGSDDLNRWQTLVPSAAVARMRHDGFTITQSAIELSSARARYLRLSWPPELRDVALSGVQARTQTAVTPVEPLWDALTPSIVPDMPGLASFDAGARLPVERVDVEFADATDAAQVTISSRPDSSAPALARHAGLFYSLSEADTRLTSAPAQIAFTTDRYWTIETTRDGGWGTRPPRLKLGWYPQELLFLAQGPGPYTLAYGSARVGPTDAPVAALLAALDDSRDRVRDATLGTAFDLGGAAMLTPPRSWRREILWGTLILAVVVLGAFAMRLLRHGTAA